MGRRTSQDSASHAKILFVLPAPSLPSVLAEVSTVTTVMAPSCSASRSPVATAEQGKDSGEDGLIKSGHSSYLSMLRKPLF